MRRAAAGLCRLLAPGDSSAGVTAEAAPPDSWQVCPFTACREYHFVSEILSSMSPQIPGVWSPAQVQNHLNTVQLSARLPSGCFSRFCPRGAQTSSRSLRLGWVSSGALKPSGSTCR